MIDQERYHHSNRISVAETISDHGIEHIVRSSSEHLTKSQRTLSAAKNDCINSENASERTRSRPISSTVQKLFWLLTVIGCSLLTEISISATHGSDVTSLIRVSDDEKTTNLKYPDLGMTAESLGRARDTDIITQSPNGHGADSFLEKTLEMSLAAVFNKVAYGTTTKRSIADNAFIPNSTAIPTIQLTTTHRYRERERNYEQKTPSQHHHQKQNYNKFSLQDLDHDHALPTSAPNADILKSNSNPTYPNPNRHHKNHGERHRIHSTPSPSAHNLLTKGQATMPMYPAELPSYSPPARSSFTPRVPEYPLNPFAEQPTLRGTNSESNINSGYNINRRPLPPPSLMPGHEKIPLRPPDLQNKPNTGSSSKEGDNTGNGDGERKKALNTPAQKPNGNRINSNQMTNNTGDTNAKSNVIHFPGMSRILSGSNGHKEDIPEVILRTVTARPSSTELQSAVPPRDSVYDMGPSNGKDDDSSDENEGDDLDTEDSDSKGGNDFVRGEDNTENGMTAEEDYGSSRFNGDEPKMQPKIKQSSPTTTGQGAQSTKKFPTQTPLHQSDMVYSTQIIQNLAATNNDKKIKQTSALGGNSKMAAERSAITIWAVAWNIHVYLSAILFTVLAVYSIFKIIFYDKLTHLVNQSYFICLHLILIMICLARIFFLCYDAYNIHFSFHLFIAELLLNLPATFLTVSFSVLILFLLLRSLNHKTNRYSALMRPLTVLIGSCAHVFLCITLHYVESYGQQQRNQQIQYQHQMIRANGDGYRLRSQTYLYNQPPRVLSLICQLIYIFTCFSLGIFYLYIYNVLKRVLHKKSQNYIHGYQNLSYAIHITIATALLFILLASLQIYGVISTSRGRLIMLSLSDNDWLQWGYQFSLRLIEISIIALMSWVTGLKTGANKVLQRDKVMEQHNVSGFALFPCTSSSSQEHFEADYPAICNANTNLHSYTLRTGKPLYDDTFALNSLGMENPIQVAGPNNAQAQHHHHHHPMSTMNKSNLFISKNGQEYQIQANGMQANANDGAYDATNGTISNQNSRTSPPFGDPHTDQLNGSGNVPDHYENPNFELHPTGNYHKNHHGYGQQDNCYTEPIGVDMMYNANGDGTAVTANGDAYDFQNFERPSYTERPTIVRGNTEFRASKNLKALVKSNSNSSNGYDQPQNNLSGKSSHHNPMHYNSFDRRGIRKSGTLNSIGNNDYRRNNTISTQNVLGQQMGARTLNTSRYPHDYNVHRSTAARASNNSATSSRDRNQAVSDNVNDYGDNISHDSTEAIRAMNYNQDMVLFKAQRDHLLSMNQNSDSAQNGASSGDSTTSMLVAEHGFVRFRPMDDAGNRSGSSSLNSDNTNVKNSPAIMQRHHKRSLTNS